MCCSSFSPSRSPASSASTSSAVLSAQKLTRRAVRTVRSAQPWPAGCGSARPCRRQTARDIDRAGVQVVDEGLAVDAAGGEIHDLPHRVIGRIERDAVQFFKPRAQLPIQRGNVCNAGAQLLLALRGGHAETHNVGRVLGAGAQAALLMAAR